MKILIAGAGGFVGQALIQELVKEGHEILALVRSKKGQTHFHGQVKYITGDLLKSDDLPEIKSLDKAYYLVHGLKSVEEDFEHEEALAAVNFVNWVRGTNCSIIYLGGLSPKKEHLSHHMRSRNLTGAILAASGLATIEFRASIILGEGSVSFEMIKALVERFPFRPSFSLLQQKCQPLGLDDLIKYLVQGLNLEVKGHRLIEIGGPTALTYGELLDLYAELANLKRKTVTIPNIDKKVLLKLLDYAIPELADIGKKLAQSLEYPSVVTNDEAKDLFPQIQTQELKEAMNQARTHSKSEYPAIWDKEFLKELLSDKILTQSGLLSPDLMRNLERIGKVKDIILRK